MRQALIDFANRLRKVGIGVSQAEVMDGASCLQCINIGDRTQFKNALRSTLIKRSRDIPVFDTLFDLHFSVNPLTGAETAFELYRQRHFVNQLLTAIPRQNGAQFSAMTAMILTGNSAELTRALLEAIESLSLKKLDFAPILGRYFENEVGKKLEIEKVRQELPLILREMSRLGIDKNLIELFRGQATQAIDTVEKAIERFVRSEVQALRFTAYRRIEGEEIKERNLYHLTDEDILAMRQEVEKLTKRLKDRIGMRFRQANRKLLDVRRTMRSNVGYGGLLPDLRLKNRIYREMVSLNGYDIFIFKTDLLDFLRSKGGFG